MAEISNERVPNPLAKRDVAALIGILALLEGEHLAGSLDDRLGRRIAQRLEVVDLLADGSQSVALRQALNDMNHRLRYALGECDEPPHDTRS
jgi:hypothetical protein